MVTSEDKKLWELALIHLRSCLFYDASLKYHSNIHFPIDCAFAAVKLLLPKHHMLRTLLEPHSTGSLVMSEVVLHDPKSPIMDGDFLLWNPAMFSAENLRKIVN